MKRVKKCGVILVLNKSEERSEKRVDFVHTAVFDRARNWCVKKFSLSERIYFVHVRHFRAVFIYFGKEVWLWFCFNFRLVLVVLWRFLEIHVNFMIIRRFLMYFADFWANFCVFWRLFCFTGSNGHWRNPFYLSKFMITIGYSFVDKNHFFVEKYDKKLRNFCSFSFFPVFS